MQKATLAGGCFWCVEAVFQEVKGVNKVVSGYSGGHTNDPKYEEITGSGHAEAVEITFDPKIISYKELLQIFYYVHDPTTLNRQGNDVGEQYRSVIFYISEEQRKTAEDVTKNFAPTLWDKPIVTEITKLEKFWPAENYHQNFYKNNPAQPYCQVVINPKLEKFRKRFMSLLKSH
ncbi:MAG TPA: peptide-methionine (S)-S-oxide reductase MsrA [Candidatus Saccharimonadales bacterium]|nr:peptide-methionine (S)-S-oxide reductase MsrA [Candidatus Saccharimonadales bacterium]